MLRGQINLHFMVSAIIFLGVVIYLIHVLLNSSPFYGEDIESDILYSKAYQVSEFLIKDSGQPKNWTSDNFDRVGLVSEPHLLNRSKINELNDICNSNNITKKVKLLSSFSSQDNSLSMEINYLNGTTVLDCFLGGESLGTKASIKRIGVLDGLLVEVRVYVS